MPLIGRHSLEKRILEHLQLHYPVTARQLAAALRVFEKRILMELRRMQTKGMVELDVLPDDVFVRCLVVFRPRRGEEGGGRGEEGGGLVEGGRGKEREKKGKKKEKEGGTDPAYL